VTTPAKGKVVRVDVREIELLLGRAEVYMPAGDFAHVTALSKTLLEVTRLLAIPGTSVVQLRRMLGISCRKKRPQETTQGPDEEGASSPPPPPEAPAPEPPSEETGPCRILVSSMLGR
jgi:hypothetical protein